jgi:peroxiredoxin
MAIGCTDQGIDMKIARTLLGLLVLLLIGCSKTAETTPIKEGGSTAVEVVPTAPHSHNKPTAEWTANEILQKLLARYRQAKTYRDNAIVRLTFRRDGQPFSEEAPAAVALERPSKLSIVAYQATVKCDGKELKARIDDPPSNNLDSQFVVRPAPAQIRLADFADDRLLYDILGSRLGRQPIQLELLLENSGLVTAFGSDVACQRLDDATHAGRNCFRVEVPSATGPLTFWVDQSDFTLRRLDFSAAALVPDAAQDPSVTNLELFADLRDAKIDEPIPASQFTLDVPAGAKRMNRFARPLQPLPTKLLGQRPPAFYFTRLDGSRVSEGDLQGKLAVLTWYHDNPACEATLQQVSQANERLASDGGVVFLAVATDPTAIKNEAIQKRLAEWNVTLPVVRDLEAFGDKSFHIEGHPSIVILDQRGAVQHFQVGGSPELADQLIAILERLKRGDDLAAEALSQRAAMQKRYEELVARGGPEPDELLDIPEAVIRRRSEPKNLQIKPLWTNSDLKNAGNILLTESQGQTRVLVFDGPRAIAEIDAQGRFAARHALDIPEQAAVTFARTATDKEGRRYFVASAPLAPQVFVFDENWKLLLSYPPPDHAPLAVIDMNLAELDDPADGPEILVATASGAGVVALSLAGEVRWRNRAVPSAISAAVLPAGDIGSLGIFVAGEESGAVVRLNRFGHEEPPVKVANRPIGRIFAAGISSSEQASLLGLSSNSKGEPIAVGLNDTLQERWNYPLPPGVHQRPIEPIHWSRVIAGHGGEWWIAGPDGSIHVITADGKLFDSFYYGAPLMGLAAAKIGERALLLVATSDGLAAWEVQSPAASKRKREY